MKDSHDKVSSDQAPLLGAPAAGSIHPEPSENETQFFELLSHLKQVFWIQNADDTAVEYVSPSYQKVWGRSRASLYANAPSFLDSVHPDDLQCITEAIAKKRENEGYDVEHRIVRPDGTSRWVWTRSYLVRNEAGESPRYAGIAEDISERKWAEKERSRLAAILEHTDDSIVSITLDGCARR